MGFTVPAFSLTAGFYSGGVFPGGGARLTSLANLAYGRRVMTQFWDWAIAGEPGIFAVLLVPAGTDVRDYASTTGRDAVECPAGSGRVYLVDYVDDLGKGFSNEHRFALMEKLIPWPTPIP